MNLSHVERYFSDVLSAMESKEPISLDYDRNDCGKNKITIDDNLFIIGTVNVDETTYAFSPKVLDRANVIEFGSMSIDNYFESFSSYNPKGNIEYLENCLDGIEVRFMDAKSIIIELEKVDQDMVNKIKTDLEFFRHEMETINQSFGFRTVDEIMRFMYVACKYMGWKKFDWKRFFDAQIKQKLLPKIHGNASVRNCLKNICVKCEENGYLQSKNKIDHMISTLENNRYVTFNS